MLDILGFWAMVSTFTFILSVPVLWIVMCIGYFTLYKITIKRTLMPNTYVKK